METVINSVAITSCRTKWSIVICHILLPFSGETDGEYPRSSAHAVGCTFDRNLTLMPRSYVVFKMPELVVMKGRLVSFSKLNKPNIYLSLLEL